MTNKCELCGERYETYPIILCCDPLCFAHFLADEQKPDGMFRAICEKCRNKLERKNEKQKKVTETLTQILKCYESYRTTLGLPKEKAIKKTLITYDDFYEWLKEKK